VLFLHSLQIFKRSCKLRLEEQRQQANEGPSLGQNAKHSQAKVRPELLAAVTFKS